MIMGMSISVKDSRAEKIVEAAKIKAVKNKVSVSEVVIKLLDKWSRDEIEVPGGKNNRSN
jgi:predicted CopG family antitoxin